MMSSHFDVLIVGAGHAGAQAAIALRQANFQGSICVVGEELELPYERPPLSKDYLSQDKSFERILIRPPSFWTERKVVLLTGTRVVRVNARAMQVTTMAGEDIRYSQLIWATGGTPRRLTCPGHDLVGVHSVRTRADVDRIMGELSTTSRVAVVGGGYIGLEAAAVLTKLGKQVTIFEAQERVLARVAGEPLSRFFEAEHRAHGVDIRLETVVECIEGNNGKVSGVRLADGEVVPCEMVIVGIGIIPATEALTQAGAQGANGVSVDGNGRTSLPNIFAIGDCAQHQNQFAGGSAIRLESVQNANDMATVVAKTITGNAAPYACVPWFWSNQYDLKLQTVGLSTGHDQTVVRGDLTARAFSVVYLREGRIIALDCVNSVKDYVQGKQMVLEGSIIDPDELSKAVSLKELMVPAPA